MHLQKPGILHEDYCDRMHSLHYSQDTRFTLPDIDLCGGESLPVEEEETVQETMSGAFD